MILRLVCRRSLPLLVALAVIGCVAERWSAAELAPSTVAVVPANVLAGSAAAEVRVALRRQDGLPFFWQGMRLRIAASGCGEATLVPVDSVGSARAAIGPCDEGIHAVRAAIEVDGFSVTLPQASAINAVAPIVAGSDAIASGSRLSLAVVTDATYVGTVRFDATDPLAELPAPVAVPASAHGVLLLAQQAVLRTDGTQRLRAVDVASGRVLGEETFEVVASASAVTGQGALRLAVTAPAEAEAGSKVTVAVAAVGPDGRLLAPPGGAALTVTDPLATVPAAPDGASGASRRAPAVFADLTFGTAGIVTVTARSGEGGAGTARVHVRPGPAARLWLRPADSATAGPFVAGTGPQLELGAQDAFGNAVADVPGPVQLAASDAAAVLPAALPPAPGGVGPRRFAVRFATAGMPVVSARSASGLVAAWAPQSVTAGVAARLDLRVPPAVAHVPVGGLVAVVTDAYGNAVRGFVGSVALSSDDAGATLPGPATFAAGGPASVALPGSATFSRNGPVRVRAVATPVPPSPTLAPADTTVQVAPSVAAVAQLTLTVTSGATRVADGVQAATLRVDALDAQGVAASGRALTVRAGTGVAVGVLSADGRGVAWGAPGAPVTGITGATGQLVVLARTTRAGVATVTATAPAVSGTATLTFGPGRLAFPPSTLVAAPNGAAADGVAAVGVALVARDAHGNLLAGQAVHLASNQGGDVLAPTATTDASGQLLVPLRGTTVGTRTVTVRVDGQVLAASARFGAGPPVAAASFFAATPRTIFADGQAEATVTLLLADARGNAASAQAVHFSAVGPGHTFAASDAVTDAQGLATTTVRATAVGATVLHAVSGSLDLTTALTATAGPAVGGTSTLLLSPAAPVADGVSAVTASLVVRDALGRPVPGVKVALTATGSGNAIVPASAVTAADGSVTATLRTTVAQAKAVVATFAGATVSTPVTFVAGAAAAGASTVAAGPLAAVADGSSGVTLSATLRDVYGNAVTNQVVTFGSSGTANLLSAPTAVTNAAGVAQVTLRSTRAEPKAISASFGGTQVTTTATFVAGPAAQATSAVTVTAAPAVADGAHPITLTATIRDAYGNPVPGQAVILTSSGTGNSLSSGTGTTSASGTVAVTLATTVAETKVVTAQAGGISVSTSLTFVAGPPVAGQSMLTASPTTATADGASQVTLTATLRDAQGNWAAGQTLTFASTGSGNALSPASATTAADGTASLTLSSTVAGPKTVTASFASTSVSTSVTFVAGPLSAGTSTLSASPGSVTADGVATTTVTATARDAQNNPVAGQSVTLSSTGAGNTLSATSGSTNASGTFTATLASTVAQGKTLTATLGSVTLNAGVTFVPGAPSSANSSVAAGGGTPIADGSSTSALTVTVKDAQGNLVSGQAVTLTASGSGNTFAPASGITNASGVFTASLSSTVAEAKVVTASFASTSVSTSVTFVAGPVAAGTSQVAASPASLVADGSTTTLLTVTARDAHGNLVAGQAVTLTSTGSANTFSATSGTTGAGGTLTATLASTVAESKTVVARFDSSTSVSVVVTFVAGAAAAPPSTLAASPASLVADGVAATTLTATIADAQGNARAGQSVSFAATGSGNTFSSTTATTDGSGTAQVTLASTVAEAKTLTATFSGQNATCGVTFVAGALSAATSGIGVTPSTFIANGSSVATITVSARDAFNNPIAGQSVQISASGTGNSLSPTNATTGAGGDVVAQLTTTVAELKTITALMGSLSLPVNATAVNDVASAMSGPTAQTAAPAYVGKQVTFVSTFYDANANLVRSSAPLVHLSSTGVSTTLPADYQMTATDAGTVASPVTVNSGGNVLLTVAAGPPGSVSGSVAFHADAVAAAVAGKSSLCALLQSNNLKCWGANNYGQLGLGDTTSRGAVGSALPLVSLGTGRTPLSTVVGYDYACARLDDATVKCWGNAFQGSLGQGDNTNRGTSAGQMGNSLPAIALGTGRTATNIWAGTMGYHVCARLDNASLKCWGYNGDGQLGYGDTATRGKAGGTMGDSLPVVALGTGRTASTVAGMDYGTCALLDNSQIKCWGSNAYGELGIGDGTNRGLAAAQMGDSLPYVNLGTGRSAVSVSCGSDHCCARLDNSTVKCWGRSQYGQLGLGDTTTRGTTAATMGDSLPAVSLGTGRTAAALALGSSHSCAILDNGSVKCWGSNGAGELGLGDSAARGDAAGEMGDSLPAVALGTGRTAVKITAGYNETCAILDDGSLKCWGQNPFYATVGTSAGSMGDNLPAQTLW